MEIANSILHSIVTTLRLLTYNKVGFMGFLGVVFIILLSYFGPYIWPPEIGADIGAIYEPPSAEHWLGTDDSGKDIWLQIVNGGQEVIYAAVVAAVVSTLIAISFGSLAGFIGGWIDSVIVAITDIFLTIPTLPLLAVLAAFIKLNNMTLLGILLGVLGWPSLLRAVRRRFRSRSATLLKQRVLDLGTWHISPQMIPNMMTYIAISFTLAFTGAIYGQVGLILLGLAPFSESNWSVMISWGWNHGAMFFKNSVWYIMSPIVAIAVLQLSVITMTRSLELVFNPRLRASE
ncbi:MAG: ABC transporter permease subunit [Caldilineaceae bacterium]